MANEENFLYTQFDNVFFEKTRLSIITILYKEERASFNQLKALIGGSDGAIYSHLQKLLSSEYILEKKEIIGSSLHTIYSLTENGRDIFKKYIKFLEKMIKQ
jgi:predicted transcriptional regulator